MGGLAGYAPWAVLAAAGGVSVLGAAVGGVVIGANGGVWSSGEIPPDIRELIGIALLVLLMSAPGPARMRAVARRDGDAVLCARGFGSGVVKTYLIQTCWVPLLAVLVCVSAVVGSLWAAVAAGAVPLLSAAAGGLATVLALVVVAAARQGLVFFSAGRGPLGGWRAVWVAVVSGVVVGLLLSTGAAGRVPWLFEGLGTLFYDASLGTVRRPAAMLAAAPGWAAAGWLVLRATRLGLRRVVHPGATRLGAVGGGSRRSRSFSGRPLAAAGQGRLLGLTRAVPGPFLLIRIPLFVVSVMGAAALHRAGTGDPIGGVGGRMLMSFTPAIVVILGARSWLPVSGADRFAGDLRGVFGGVGARWRDELRAGWGLHFAFLLSLGVPLLVVIAWGTDRLGFAPEIVVFFVGLAALAAAVSVATSVFWPSPWLDPREIFLNSRGYFVEQAVISVTSAPFAVVAGADPPAWVLSVVGLAYLAAALAVVGFLQRRGVGLWRS